MSAKKPLQTIGDVLRRDAKRRWRRANPDKCRSYYQAHKLRQWEAEQAAKQGNLPV